MEDVLWEVMVRLIKGSLTRREPTVGMGDRSLPRRDR